MVLKHWEEREEPELRARALVAALAARASRPRSRDALALVFPPPPIQGLGTTGGFEFLIEDREGRGVQALADVADRFMAEARKRPELVRPLHALLGPRAPAPIRARPGQGPEPGRAGLHGLRDASGLPGRLTTSTTSTASARPGESTSSPRATAAGSPTTSWR